MKISEFFSTLYLRRLKIIEVKTKVVDTNEFSSNSILNFYVLYKANMLHGIGS